MDRSREWFKYYGRYNNIWLLVTFSVALNEILKVFQLSTHTEKPRVILADTIKGKGVSFMEGQTAWHGVAPSKEDYEKALKELE